MEIKVIDNKILSDGYIFTKSFAIISKNKVFLVNQKQGTTILLDKSLIGDFVNDWLTKINEDLFLKFIQRNFIVEDKKTTKVKLNCLPTFFLIDFTNICNFNCIYCFRDLKNNREITLEHLNAICDYIVDYCRKHRISRITVQPWGGEPLLAYKKIIYCYNRISKFGINVNMTIETNGSILNEEIIKFIKNFDVQIGISIDGSECLHNKQRQSKTCDYKLILKNVQTLHKNNIKDISSISVVTQKGIEYIDSTVKTIAEVFKINNLKLNLVHNSDFKDSYTQFRDEEIEEFVCRLYNSIKKYRIKNQRIIESNIQQRIKNLLYRNNSNICLSSGCQGGYRMISFSSNGDIYPCEMVDYEEEKIGSIYSGKDLIDMLLESTHEKKYFQRKYNIKCDDCPWWYYCKGGCTSAIRYAKTTSGIDEIGCRINKKLYMLIVEDILNDNLNDVFKEDNDE
jgi:uncharacterized protein